MLKRKKLLSLITIALILIMVLSACGGGESENKPSDPNVPNDSSEGKGSDSSNEKKPVNLTVEVFERGQTGQLPGDDNWNTDYVKENLKKEYPHIDITYVSIPRAEEKEKLNVLMASKQAPDISLTYDVDMLYNFIRQGGVTEVGEYVEEYGDTLKSFLGETLDYGIFDGGQYAIPAKRVLLPRYGAWVRKDWLDKIDLDLPTTTDEFYTMLKGFKDKDPGGLGGNNIPFALTINYSDPEWPAAPLLQSFITELTEEEFYTLPQWLKPGYKDGMRLLNKLYDEGMINPDFALDKDSAQYTQLIAQGKVGSFICDVALPLGDTGSLQSLQKNVEGAELVPMDPFTNYEGKTAKLIYDPVGIYCFIPSTCKNPEEAIMYLDFISKDNVRFDLQNGVEGVNYELQEDGIPVIIEAPEGDRKGMSPPSIDMTLTINGSDFGDIATNVKAQALKYSDPLHQDLYTKVHDMFVKDGYYQPRFDRPIEAQSKYGAALVEIGKEIFVKAITCSPNDFDKVYDEQVQEFLNRGGQEVIDEKTEAYNAMKAQ